MIHHIDLKVQAVAAIAILAASQQVETVLRFTLLILSIVYTIYRLIDRFEEKHRQKNKIVNPEDESENTLTEPNKDN